MVFIADQICIHRHTLSLNIRWRLVVMFVLLQVICEQLLRIRGLFALRRAISTNYDSLGTPIAQRLRARARLLAGAVAP